MGIRTVLQKKFQNLFVAVVLSENECIIRCKVLKDGEIKKTSTKAFELTSLDALDENIEKYLIALQDEFNFVYIAFLLNSMGQGAIPGVTSSSFEEHHVDMQHVHHLSFFKQWSAYASHIEIKWANNIFSEVGLDLVYSPFVILNNFVTTQKLKNRPTCYILNCQDFFLLAIFEDYKMHFGAFFRTQSDTAFTTDTEVNDWESQEKEENITDLGELPEIEEEREDNYTDLDDMNDLDDFSSADSFSDVDDKKTLGHFQGLDGIREEDTSLELYGRDLLVYKYLTSSLGEYYHNPIYHSVFIEEIVIFDNYEISSELIHQLEDDLMMDVEIHKVDVADRMCDIAIEEVFG